MAYKRVVAAAVFAALMATGATQVQAQAGGCRKQCDASYGVCSKKAGQETACLRTWHSCKKSCTAKALAAANTRTTAAGKPAPTARGR